VAILAIGIIYVSQPSVRVAGQEFMADLNRRWDDWRYNDKHRNDREAMEDGYGWNADSNNRLMYRGPKNNNNNNLCSNAAKLIKCVGIGVALATAIVELIYQGITCFADGTACSNDSQPGKLVVPSETSTATTKNPTPKISISVTPKPNCPPYINCPTSTPALSTPTQATKPTTAPKTMPIDTFEKRLQNKGLWN
jgi:hypothetical protein